MTTSSHRTLLLFLITQLLALPSTQASRELLLNAPSPGDSLLLMQPSREWGPRGDLSRAERQKHNTRARHLRASHNAGQTVPYAKGGSGPAGALTYEEQQERLQWHIGAGLRLHLEEPTTQHEGQGDGSDARRADFKKGSSENRIVTKGQRKQILESLGLNSSSLHTPYDPLQASMASSDLTAAATKYPLAHKEDDPSPSAEEQQSENPGQREPAAPPMNAAVRVPGPLAGGRRPNGRSAQRYSDKGSPLAQKKLSSAAQAVAMANAAEAAAEAEAAEALGSEGPGAQAQVDTKDTSSARVAIVPESPEKAAKHSALAQAAAAAEAAEGDHAHFLSEAARVHAEGGLQDGAERASDEAHSDVQVS